MAANPQPVPENKNRMITCRVCKKEVAVITSPHLAKHKLTRAEYQEKYPGAPLRSEQYVERKRAIYADPVKGEGVRQGLAKGRTPEVRVKAMDTMVKNGNVADSAFMGSISRLAWAPERKKAHSQNIRLAQLRPERIERQSEVAIKMWADRKAREARLVELERLLAESKEPDKQIHQLEKLELTENIAKKLAEPTKYMWMSPNEVAETFGINRATFFRNVDHYPRLKKGPKRWYLTSSVIDQLNAQPKK